MTTNDALSVIAVIGWLLTWLLGVAIGALVGWRMRGKADRQPTPKETA